MKQKRFSWILYFIIITIVMTIAVQVYWNYKNYQINKQQLINQVQISLDNAVASYYADIAKNNHYPFYNLDTKVDTISFKNIDITKEFNLDSIFTFIQKDLRNYTDSTTVIIDNAGQHQYDHTKCVDTCKHSIFPNFQPRFAVMKGEKLEDSLRMLKGISSLYISITTDSLDFKKLQSILNKELERKKISIPYTLRQYNYGQVITNLKESDLPKDYLSTFSKSAYLKPGEELELQYANISKHTLQRSSFGILLSTLLSLAIISSLLYLLRIIRQQKELAEIKNDLISNITHEFKTPITTISTAIEAIQHFDALNDTDKTKKYLSISDKQLKKLHLMVEKLLETATLDSEKLLLKKETVNIIDFTQKIVEKHQLLATDKEIQFSSNTDSLHTDVDTFHFENAIANLIDNAIKYGGNQIDVSISKVLERIEITVADNGGMIEKSQRDKIFDKFYRIPKGNTHDVKGFGIGLYYTKKIIEKHEGSIELLANAKNTIFKITLDA